MNRGSNPGRGKRIFFFFSKTSRLSLCNRGALPGVRRPGNEDNHWPVRNVEIKKECSYVSTLPMLYGCMAGQGQRYIYKCRVSLKLLRNAGWWIGKDVTGSDLDVSVVPSRQHPRTKTDIQEGRNRRLRVTRQQNRGVIAQPVRIQLWKFKHTVSQKPVLTQKDWVEFTNFDYLWLFAKFVMTQYRK